MKKTIEQALQELATVRQWEMGKMVEVFGQCTVADLKEYVGELTISTTGFKKADWVNQAVSKLMDEKRQEEVSKVQAILDQQHKELATELSSMDIETLTLTQLRSYARELGVYTTKHTKKAELISELSEKIREVIGEVEADDNVVTIVEQLQTVKCEKDMLHLLAGYSAKITEEMYYLAFGEEPKREEWKRDLAKTEIKLDVWRKNCEKKLAWLNNRFNRLMLMLEDFAQYRWKTEEILQLREEIPPKIKHWEMWQKVLSAHEAKQDLQLLEEAYEHHRLVNFGGNFMDIRYVELEDIEKARERVRLLCA